MATVYKGYDPVLDRLVVIKVLALHLTWEEQFVQRFMQEARAAARLNHPNIITIYDVGQQDTWYYFVMEFLSGLSLQELLRQRGAMPPDQVLRILRQLADALDYAHQEGLVHRDLKPGNVLFGSRGRPVLTDFGLAQVASEGGEGSDITVGTPEYMAPEQLAGGEIGSWTDLYSLAVLTYEMLAGRPPSKISMGPSLLYQVLNEKPPPLRSFRPELPEAVDVVLDRALSKEPDSRFKRGSVFVAALEAALTGRELPPMEEEEPVPAVLVPEMEEEALLLQGVGEMVWEADPLIGAAAVGAYAPAASPGQGRSSEAIPYTRSNRNMSVPPGGAAVVGGMPAEYVEQRTLRALPVWIWIVLGAAVMVLIVGLSSLLASGIIALSRPTATPPPTATATITLTPMPTATPTAAPTASETPLPTDTPAPTETSAPTSTSTPTAGPTETPAPTETAAPTRPPVVVPTDTIPPTEEPTPTITFTPSPRPTDQPTQGPPTYTPTPTATDTPEPTQPTATPTDTPLPAIPTLTPKPTETPTPPTATPTYTPTVPPIPTSTPTP